MSLSLLDQTRKISRLLHDNPSKVVVFNDICACVGELLAASCMVVSTKGKVLGIYEHPAAPDLTLLLKDSVGDLIDTKLNERFLSVLSTKENVNLQTLGFERSVARKSAAILLPVYFAGERMGTTFIFRCGKKNEQGLDQGFDMDEIILSEYANTIIELSITRALDEEESAEERNQLALSSALDSLSQSEQRAIECLIRELGGEEGDLITSRVATKYEITRSIIVNALRKLEGAGVLTTTSMGMRGTHIKILNMTILDKYAPEPKTESVGRIQKQRLKLKQMY